VSKVLISARFFGFLSDKNYNIFKDNNIEIIHNPYQGDALSEDKLLELLPGVNGLLTGVDQVSKRVIDNAKDLKVISKFGSGVDNIDLNAARGKGIAVTNVPHANENAVADMAFGLMLSIARNIPLAYKRVKEGKWPHMVGAEVYNKTIGIIGLGHIGQKIVRRAIGFNMNVLAFEKYPDYNFVKDKPVEFVELDRLLKESDFISIHCPLTEETRNLINKRELKLMKSSAFLINTARGGIVNEVALYVALLNKEIAGAAMDVFTEEPANDDRLINLQNFIATPHIAFCTKEAIENMESTSAQNIVDVLEGREPQYTVV